ncbi:MAG: hypothetical protein ACAI35_04340 [Candidatus Methylacidiphilales bacterium]|nr:hypothetical protein [Candidatus Methylacidiphilales bacterium]
MKQRIYKALSAITMQPRSELELHETISKLLTAQGIVHRREVKTNRGTVDFVIGDIAMEIKIKGGSIDIARQLIRYLQDPQFTSLILVTTKAIKLPITEVETPEGNKPVFVIELWRNFI